MAKKPAIAPPSQDQLEKEAVDRLKEARRRKAYWALDFKECYFFAAPHRQRQITTDTMPLAAPIHDASELQTSLAFELCQDFVTEVVNTFMPEAQRWCERGRGMYVSEDAWNKKITDKGKQTTIAKMVRAQDEQIFEAMKASNLYPEIAKAFYPDLAIGTSALWIEPRRPSHPITVKAIPLSELDVSLGPDGEIDDRFVTRWTLNRYVKALLPKEAKISEELAKTIESKPEDVTEIVFGFWRIWGDEADEVWQHVVLVKDEKVHDATLRGEGCCPLIVMRFNPSPDWPFGMGPEIQGLPDFRQVDELEANKIEAVGHALRPPVTYPDDSFTNVEQGIEDGYAYPIRVGSHDAVKTIYPPAQIDVGVYELESIIRRLRRLFFIDFPEQTGDTPPTLGQWLDEMARAQRRIGTPGMPFWREGPARIFLRFQYLLEKAGTIEPIKVDGKSVSLRAYNPSQRAAEQQELAMAARWLELMSQFFPEEFKAMVNGRATMEAFLEKMRVTLVTFRPEEEVKAVIQNVIAPLLAGKLGGGVDPSGVNAPTTP